MATTLKVLGQFDGPSAEATLYTVPASTSTVCSTIVVCNRSTATTFRIRINIAGAINNDKQFIAYDAPLGANEYKTLTIGLTLAATDLVKIESGSVNVSFSLFGQEIT